MRWQISIKATAGTSYLWKYYKIPCSQCKFSMCIKLFKSRTHNPFGKHLEILVNQGLCDENNIPFVIKDCVNQLKDNIAVPGILIASAPLNVTTKAYGRIKKGKLSKYDALGNPHVASDILKKFLHELPVSLISIDLNRSFSSRFFNRIINRTCRSDDGLHDELRRISIDFLKMLPVLHSISLLYLLQFFALVLYEEANGVSAAALVNTYAPLLARRRKSESQFLDGSIIILKFMIENISWILHDLWIELNKNCFFSIMREFLSHSKHHHIVSKISTWKFSRTESVSTLIVPQSFWRVMKIYNIKCRLNQFSATTKMLKKKKEPHSHRIKTVAHRKIPTSKASMPIKTAFIPLGRSLSGSELEHHRQSCIQNNDNN